MSRLVGYGVDLQMDFIYEDGALYVPNVEYILDNVMQITNQMKSKEITSLLSVDWHNVHDKEFQQFPIHCVKYTTGAQIVPYALYATTPTVIGGDEEHLSCTFHNRLVDSEQFIIQKKCINVFHHTDGNPNLVPLLKRLNITHILVYGVCTELCVQSAVLGLLAHGYIVYLAKPAIKSLTDAAGDLSIDFMRECGAIILEDMQSVTNIINSFEGEE